MTKDHRVALETTTKTGSPDLCRKCREEPVYVSPRGKPAALCVLCFFDALVEAGIFEPATEGRAGGSRVIRVLRAAGEKDETDH